MLTDSYSSYVLLFGFSTQQNVNSAANFAFTSKIGIPRVVQVLWWVLFVRQIFVPPHSEFEQHMYSSDPRPDTVSLMQVESRRAVPQASRYPDNSPPRHSPHPKPQPEHLSPQFDGREVKNHCRPRDHAHFFTFFLFFDSRPGSCQPICGII